MSDFEQWFGGSKYTQVVCPSAATKQIALDGWNAAIASMQGEAVAAKVSRQPDGRLHFTTPEGRYFDVNEHIGKTFFTYPPSASAEITRLQKELEEARKDAERYRMVRSLDVTPYDKWNKAQKALHRAMNSADTVEMIDAAIDAAISKIGGGE